MSTDTQNPPGDLTVFVCARGHARIVEDFEIGSVRCIHAGCDDAENLMRPVKYELAAVSSGSGSVRGLLDALRDPDDELVATVATNCALSNATAKDVLRVLAERFESAGGTPTPSRDQRQEAIDAGIGFAAAHADIKGLGLPHTKLARIAALAAEGAVDSLAGSGSYSSEPPSEAVETAQAAADLAERYGEAIVRIGEHLGDESISETARIIRARMTIARLDSSAVSPSVSDGEQWTCKCGYMNAVSVCTKCGEPKPVSDTGTEGEPELRSACCDLPLGATHLPNCRFEDFITEDQCVEIKLAEGSGSGTGPMLLRLCDDDGQVSHEPVDALGIPSGDKSYLERHNRLKALGNPAALPVTEPFACTGSGHLAGQHIRCTSSAHKSVPVASSVGDRERMKSEMLTQFAPATVMPDTPGPCFPGDESNEKTDEDLARARERWGSAGSVGDERLRLTVGRFNGGQWFVMDPEGIEGLSDHWEVVEMVSAAGSLRVAGPSDEALESAAFVCAAWRASAPMKTTTVRPVDREMAGAVLGAAYRVDALPLRVEDWRLANVLDRLPKSIENAKSMKAAAEVQDIGWSWLLDAAVSLIDVLEIAHELLAGRVVETPPTDPDDGFAYVGITSCGCMVSAMADYDRISTEEKADWVRDRILDGLTIDRVPSEAVRQRLGYCKHTSDLPSGGGANDQKETS